MTGAADEVNVIIQQSEIANLDAEGCGEKFGTQLDPLFAVIEVLAGGGIGSAEEGASHALSSS